MSKTTVEKTRKKNWFKGLKAEFKQINWPNRKTLLKQTVAVLVTSIILGVIIWLADSGILWLKDLIGIK